MAISYIKIYLSKLINVIMSSESSKLIDNLLNLNKIINGSIENKFRYILKIYILKLIKNKIGNFEKLISFNFDELKIGFLKDIITYANENNNNFIYQFIPIDNINSYKTILKFFLNNFEKNLKMQYENINQLNFKFMEQFLLSQ